MPDLIPQFMEFNTQCWFQLNTIFTGTNWKRKPWRYWRDYIWFWMVHLNQVFDGIWKISFKPWIMDIHIMVPQENVLRSTPYLWTQNKLTNKHENILLTRCGWKCKLNQMSHWDHQVLQLLHFKNQLLSLDEPTKPEKGDLSLLCNEERGILWLPKGTSYV